MAPPMRLALNSVRNKMMLPALAAICATFLATAVTLFLSQGAAQSMARAANQDFPALQFYLDLRQQVVELRVELRTAALGDSMGLSRAEAIFVEVERMLADDGGDAIGAAQVERFESGIDEYFKAARSETAALAASPGKAGRTAGTGELSQPTEALYNKLLGRVDTEAHAARALIEERFDDVTARQRRSILIGALILLGAALASGVAAWWLAVRTARPLRELSALTQRIADGDLTVDVTVRSSDEVGQLAGGFQRMVARLREIVSTLKATAHELALAAEALNDHTRAQAAMLERQASGVAETGSTTRELEQTSAVASSRASAVLEVARRAAEMSETGRTAAERSMEEMRRIRDSVDGIVGRSTQLLEQTHQVGQIVETVRDLATQSHVLSLNASIEAARAGEAGRGFAVVAQEVRALADQSGQGAGRIAKMVQDILSAVQATREMTEKGSAGVAGSLEQIRASGESLREIGGIVRETSDAVLQIASAVQQQFVGIGQISSAMRDLDKGMEETVGRIRALEESAAQVAENATRISGIAEGFKV